MDWGREVRRTDLNFRKTESDKIFNKNIQTFSNQQINCSNLQTNKKLFNLGVITTQELIFTLTELVNSIWKFVFKKTYSLIIPIYWECCFEQLMGIIIVSIFNFSLRYIITIVCLFYKRFINSKPLSEFYSI